MEGPMAKETKEPPKHVNHEGNIKFPNPLLLQEAYQIRKNWEEWRRYLQIILLHVQQGTCKW